MDKKIEKKYNKGRYKQTENIKQRKMTNNKVLNKKNYNEAEKQQRERRKKTRKQKKIGGQGTIIKKNIKQKQKTKTQEQKRRKADLTKPREKIEKASEWRRTLFSVKSLELA